MLVRSQDKDMLCDIETMLVGCPEESYCPIFGCTSSGKYVLGTYGSIEEALYVLDLFEDYLNGEVRILKVNPNIDDIEDFKKQVSHITTTPLYTYTQDFVKTPKVFQMPEREE